MDIDKIVKCAVMSFISVTVSQAAISATPQMEKCYGIVKAGMNDCQTAAAACSGSAAKDNQPDAFIFLEKGLCEKIVGGNLVAPAKK